MTENILENLSEEQVNAIKASGGFSGSVRDGIDLLEGPTTYKPASSIPISGYEQGVRPSVGRPSDQLIRGIARKPLSVKPSGRRLKQSNCRG